MVERGGSAGGAVRVEQRAAAHVRLPWSVRSHDASSICGRVAAHRRPDRGILLRSAPFSSESLATLEDIFVVYAWGAFENAFSHLRWRGRGRVLRLFGRKRRLRRRRWCIRGLIRGRATGHSGCGRSRRCEGLSRNGRWIAGPGCGYVGFGRRRVMFPEPVAPGRKAQGDQENRASQAPDEKSAFHDGCIVTPGTRMCLGCRLAMTARTTQERCGARISSGSRARQVAR